MSKLKEIYVKGTTATSVDNYMYLSQSREMIGWDKYHNNDVVRDLKAEFIKLKDSYYAYRQSVPFGGVDSAQEQHQGGVDASIDNIDDIFEAL